MQTGIQVLGILGNPIGHTLSPVIHEAFGRMTGKKILYAPFCVEKSDLEAAVRGAHALGIRGLNVTVPHKCDVIKHLAAVDPAAAKIGAVNTLVCEAGGYKGYNTDVSGLGKAMDKAGIRLKDARVVVLGAGGAGRAVTCLCALSGAEDVVVINRSVDKAEALCREVCANFGTERIRAMTMERFLAESASLSGGGERAYVAIQCTSVGLTPGDDVSVVEDPAFFARLTDAVDIVYRPMNTKFLKLAAAAGARTLGGLSMLLWQAVDAFSLWYPEDHLTDAQIREVYDLLCGELA